MLFDNNACRCNDMLRPDMTLPMMDRDDWGPSMAPMMDDRCGCPMPAPCPPSPIIEKPIQRCVTRDICHDVPHVCPIDTRVINNHIYRHTYVPRYTCSEANVASHVYTGSCCDFV